MKIENICSTSSTDDEERLELAVLLHRIGDELHDMSTTCRNVEDALGVVISSPKAEIDQPIIAIQGLDRLRQTVEDITRLTRLIARVQALSHTDIPRQDIERTIVLTGLAERLIRSSGTNVAKKSDDQDVIWT